MQVASLYEHARKRESEVGKRGREGETKHRDLVEVTYGDSGAAEELAEHGTRRSVLVEIEPVHV